MVPKWMIVDLLLMIQVQILNSLTVLMLRAFSFVYKLFTPHSIRRTEVYMHYTHAHKCEIMWCPFIFLFCFFCSHFFFYLLHKNFFCRFTIFALYFIHSICSRLSILCPNPDGCHQLNDFYFWHIQQKYFHPAQGGKKEDDS